MAGQQEVDITIIFFGTMGMLVLALALVAFAVFYQKKRISQQIIYAQQENEYQRELLKTSIEIREREQKRIAYELHDDIGSVLTAIKMRLGKKQIHEDDISGIREQIQLLIQQVRNISHDLLPPVLNELGLNGAVQNLVRRLQEQTDITFTCEINSEVDKPILQKQDELAIFRVVQELTNNIIKHANATRVKIEINETPTLFQIDISDDGDGFLPPDKHHVNTTSLGLKTVAARVQQMNGKIFYQLNQPKGTKVFLIKKLENAV